MATKVGAILLAAGSSRRMGTVNKLLLPVEGVPMVARVAAAIVAARLPLIVVLGHEAEAVRAATLDHFDKMTVIPGSTRDLACSDSPGTPEKSWVPGQARDDGSATGNVFFSFLLAADHHFGMGHTLAAGIAAAPPDWTGAIVCLGDMPFVGADLLRRLAAALDRPEAVAVPVHDGRRGNPVGWGRAWFPRLAALTGDAGGRALLAKAHSTEVPGDASIHADIDTPAAFAHWNQG